ncbi:uncharacterized protein [Dermacentor albipictus]|uniref:uncharacterized protein isoform X1 n=1 Tax=Dermacentor albipictus TaxID=60249 RepID=UPI0038FBE97A
MIEIIPSPTNRQSIVFILNVCSSPKAPRQRFKALITKATQLARDSPLIIAGDFNAPYRTWSYPYNTKKGEDLWREALNLNLMLVTNPAFPSRCGTSSSRDTTPDLSFVRSIPKSTSGLTLVATIIPWPRTSKSTRRDSACSSTQTGTNFAKLGKSEWRLRTSLASNNGLHRLDTTSKLPPKRFVPTSRWKRWTVVPLTYCRPSNPPSPGGKDNGSTAGSEKKISEINRTIEEHCRALCKQQWDEVCKSIDEQTRSGGTWNLLKHLLDETNTKTNQRNTLARTLHTAKREYSSKEILSKLAQKYLSVASCPTPPSPDYEGSENPELDAEFRIKEIRQALHALNGRSAPGPDKITNKALRNLDEKSIAYLTDIINQAWSSGKVPEMWKSANTILIPKPRKPPSLDNLRPISLTSCVGKVAEHAMLNRLSRYLEDHDIYTQHDRLQGQTLDAGRDEAHQASHY